MISGSGRTLKKEMATRSRYSCLENSMDRRAWQATVHGGHEESDTTQQPSLTHSAITASMQFSWEVQADVIYKNDGGKEKETKL